MAKNAVVNSLLIPVRLVLFPFKVIWYFIDRAARTFWERRSPMNWSILILCIAAIIAGIMWYTHDDLKWKQPKSLFDDEKKPRKR